MKPLVPRQAIFFTNWAIPSMVIQFHNSIFAFKVPKRSSHEVSEVFCLNHEKCVPRHFSSFTFCTFILKINHAYIRPVQYQAVCPFPLIKERCCGLGQQTPRQVLKGNWEQQATNSYITTTSQPRIYCILTPPDAGSI